MTITILDLRLVSEANQSENRFTKTARKQAQQDAVALATLPLTRPKKPWTVKITRHGKGSLDNDNLQGSAKAVRDQIGFWLQPEKEIRYMRNGKVISNKGGCDAGIKWMPVQQVKSKAYSVEVEIE